MARTPRRDSASGIHHVMDRGVDHQPVFFSDEDRIELGRQLAWAHTELSVTTLAYCLMDNHLHLLLRSPPGVLSKAMQHIIGVYTRHTNDRVGRDGPLFRGRFHSIPVDTDGYLLCATGYIHRNPLVRPEVSGPGDYRWSSYRAYVGLRPIPEFLDVGPVTTLLGGPEAVAAFTEDGLETVPACAPIGIEDVRHLVDLAIATDDLTHRMDDGARRGLARTLLILLADCSPDPTLRRVVTTGLGHPSPGAASAALRRARRRHDADPMVRRVLADVRTQLERTTLGV